MNANGYILGCSGSGKSMFSKSEMFDVLLKYPNDEVIAIDPENEYKELVQAFDISQMGEQIRAVGLQVILEYVWQRVVENKKRGVRTCVWIDEFSIMFNDGAGRTTHKSGEFFAKFYKRIRKYGGVPTAITQNISEVLESPQARTTHILATGTEMYMRAF